MELCHISTARAVRESRLPADDCRLVAFAGSPQNEWLDAHTAESLLEAAPEGNIQPAGRRFYQKSCGRRPLTRSIPRSIHQEARGGTIGGSPPGSVGGTPSWRDLLCRASVPPDVLGIYVLPAGGLE